MANPPSPWIVRFASLIPKGGRVLDVAAGAGRHGRWFLERGHPVTAIDRDVSGLTDLKGDHCVEIVEADMEDGRPWPLAGRCFDAVIVTNYLYRPLLPALVAAVAPDGVLLYETFAVGNEKFGRPSNPDFLLKPGELLQAVAGSLEVIAYQHGQVEGPAVKQFIAAVPGSAAAVALPRLFFLDPPRRRGVHWWKRPGRFPKKSGEESVMAEAPHNPPFRAEHIGSLLRPPQLIEARQFHESGRLSAEKLKEVEDAAIRGVVAFQEGIGLDVVTDGELRRSTYSEFFTTTGLEGVHAENVGDGDWEYTDATGDKLPMRVPTVRSRIKWAGPTNVDSFNFLKSITKKTPKLTMPGPCYIHYRAGRAHISRDAYPDLDAFWADIVAAYHEEMKALAAAGCRYIQLDETSLPKLADPKIQKALAKRGDDWVTLLDTYTDVINAVVDGAPKEISLGMHLCRGNKRGHWQTEGGYDQVADKLFNKLKIRYFFMEYDSPRAGSFEPLRKVPDDKCVVLGLLTTKSGELEEKELLKKRIDEASRYIDRDRLCVSPQCGFSSSVIGIMNPQQQKAKLTRVVEIAREVWG